MENTKIGIRLLNEKELYRLFDELEFHVKAAKEIIARFEQYLELEIFFSS